MKQVWLRTYVRLPVRPSVRPSVRASVVRLSARPSVRASVVRVSARPSARRPLSGRPSICPPVRCLSVRPFGCKPSCTLRRYSVVWFEYCDSMVGCTYVLVVQRVCLCVRESVRRSVRCLYVRPFGRKPSCTTGTV